MQIPLFLVFTIAIIILAINPRRSSNRWSSALACCFGCGLLAIILEYELAPMYRGMKLGRDLVIWASVFDTVFYYGAPYTFLMYILSLTRAVIWPRWRLKNLLLGLVLLLPVLFMYSYPATDLLKPGAHISFYFLCAWAGPYALAANGLLLFAYYQAKTAAMKRELLLNCLLMIPMSLFVALVNYILHFGGIHFAWRYHWITIILFFGAVIFFSIKYGIFGVKLKFEQTHLAMKAMGSATALINHSLKDGLMKINFSAAELKNTCPSDDPMINRSLADIAGASQLMLQMVGRLNDYMKDFTLEETRVHVAELIDETLDSHWLFLEERGVRVERDFQTAPCLWLDGFHLREILNNVVKNAVDAMSSGGLLKIGLYQDNKNVAITIRDQGCGIPKAHLHRVTEPFFSTKGDPRVNFGLGLSYCNQVMQKHRGSLEIESEEGKGTTVYLNFPVSRLRTVESTTEPAGAEMDGGTPIGVLLVEDDPVWVEKIASLLGAPEFQLAGTAATQEAALELADTTQFDLVIMDLNLNGEAHGGIYLTAALSQICTAKIVILTSLDPEEAALDSFTAGAVSYVSKTDYLRIPHVLRALARSKTPYEILVAEFVRLKEEEQLKVLTPAELEIYRLLGQGYSQARLAKLLYKTEGTIKNQVHMILKKLEAKNRKEAVWKVRMKGLSRGKE